VPKLEGRKALNVGMPKWNFAPNRAQDERRVVHRFQVQ
jgi:hypothetical protein